MSNDLNNHSHPTGERQGGPPPASALRPSTSPERNGLGMPSRISDGDQGNPTSGLHPRWISRARPLSLAQPRGPNPLGGEGQSALPLGGGLTDSLSFQPNEPSWRELKDENSDLKRQNAALRQQNAALAQDTVDLRENLKERTRELDNAENYVQILTEDYQGQVQDLIGTGSSRQDERVGRLEAELAANQNALRCVNENFDRVEEFVKEVSNRRIEDPRTDNLGEGSSEDSDDISSGGQAGKKDFPVAAEQAEPALPPVAKSPIRQTKRQRDKVTEGQLIDASRKKARMEDWAASSASADTDDYVYRAFVRAQLPLQSLSKTQSDEPRISETIGEPSSPPAPQSMEEAPEQTADEKRAAWAAQSRARDKQYFTQNQTKRPLSLAEAERRGISPYQATEMIKEKYLQVTTGPDGREKEEWVERVNDPSQQPVAREEVEAMAKGEEAPASHPQIAPQPKLPAKAEVKSSPDKKPTKPKKVVRNFMAEATIYAEEHGMALTEAFEILRPKPEKKAKPSRPGQAISDYEALGNDPIPSIEATRSANPGPQKLPPSPVKEEPWRIFSTRFSVPATTAPPPAVPQPDKTGGEPKGKSSNIKARDQVAGQRQQQGGATRGAIRGEIICYYCGKPGHVHAKCPNKAHQTEDKGRRVERGGGSDRGHGGDRGGNPFTSLADKSGGA